jgi:hypothetical protein
MLCRAEAKRKRTPSQISIVKNKSRTPTRRRGELLPRPLKNLAGATELDRDDVSHAGGQRHESVRPGLRRLAGARDQSRRSGFQEMRSDG